MEVLINQPDIKVIKTIPSSLGVVDYFMVLCEREISATYFSSNNYDGMGIWGDNSENAIAFCIDDDDFNLPIYILHATASDRAEPAQFIPKLKDNAEFFAKNVTSFDSSCILHCIAAKHSDELIHLKTGFDYGYPDEGPTSWDTMHLIFDEYIKLAVNYHAFRDVYETAQAIWLEAEL